MATKKLADLGDEVRDPVSGFKGIVVSVIRHLHGCEQVTIQAPVNKEGKWGEAYSVDRPRIEVLKSQKVPTGLQDTGGC